MPKQLNIYINIYIPDQINVFFYNFFQPCLSVSVGARYYMAAAYVLVVMM